MADTRWVPHAKRLVDQLVAAGAITDNAIERAFRDTPRHLFIHRGKTWGAGEARDRVVVGGTDASEDDLRLIYQDAVIEIKAGSTSSQPAVMARMLEDLGLRKDMQVLEIGTGSGWNAALMAAVCGGRHVFTIELDRELATTAARLFKQLGYAGVTVGCGDGALGYPPGGPYDGVLVTAACDDLAPAWLEQLADPGVILFPWRLHAGTNSTAAAALRLERSGEALEGRFTQCLHVAPLVSRHIACPPEQAPGAVPEPGGSGVVVSRVPMPEGCRARTKVWSLAFFLGLNLRPSARMLGDGVTVADLQAGELVRLAPPGADLELEGELGEHVESIIAGWQGLGSPGMEDYRLAVFSAAKPPEGEWIIRRRHFWYRVSLPAQP